MLHTNIVYLIILNLFFIFVYLTSEFLFKKECKTNKSKEYLRKLTHIETSILFILATFTLNQFFFILLVIESLISVIVSKYLHIFHSLNDSRSKKGNWGGIFYALALIIIALIFYKQTYLIREALLVTGISDSLAALTGINIPIKQYNILNDNKSIMGTFIFFISTTFIFIASNINYIPTMILAGILSITESLSFNGSDNFTLILITPIILILGWGYDLIIFSLFLSIFVLLLLFPLKKFNIKSK